MQLSPEAEAFRQQLVNDGFEVVTREWEANTHNASHSHPFEVRALVLKGELRLAWAGHDQKFGPGQVFTMAPGCAHEEWYGAEGATFLSGRKMPTAQ
jgi:quercetin dioxygenase-like cupin family protein